MVDNRDILRVVEEAVIREVQHSTPALEVMQKVCNAYNEPFTIQMVPGNDRHFYATAPKINSIYSDTCLSSIGPELRREEIPLCQGSVSFTLSSWIYETLQQEEAVRLIVSQAVRALSTREALQSIPVRVIDSDRTIICRAPKPQVLIHPSPTGPAYTFMIRFPIGIGISQQLRSTLETKVCKSCSQRLKCANRKSVV